MRKITVYKIDDGDIPSPMMIESSFNLLYEFADRLRDRETLTYKAFHRVVDNREFTEADLDLLENYARAVIRAAEEKYSKDPFISAPWRDAILQNTARLCGVMAQLRDAMNGCPE